MLLLLCSSSESSLRWAPTSSWKCVLACGVFSLGYYHSELWMSRALPNSFVGEMALEESIYMHAYPALVNDLMPNVLPYFCNAGAKRQD